MLFCSWSVYVFLISILLMMDVLVMTKVNMLNSADIFFCSSPVVLLMLCSILLLLLCTMYMLMLCSMSIRVQWFFDFQNETNTILPNCCKTPSPKFHVLNFFSKFLLSIVLWSIKKVSVYFHRDFLKIKTLPRVRRVCARLKSLVFSYCTPKNIPNGKKCVGFQKSTLWNPIDGNC